MKKQQSTSALSNAAGTPPQDNVSATSSQRIRQLRKKTPEAQQLAEQIIAGNKTALSRGITFIESQQAKHQYIAAQLIEYCLPKANKSIRIGITGVPGVGKSTFIEAFGNLLITQDKKVAVLAVDPTSSVTKGSILGDKTRMETLVKEQDAFIRPSASGETLGGVARKTRESIILCEAAGFDHILIETVGVGQSETAVHSMTDFFLLLKLAGAGDELQGIKRGIIEMADAIIINKADGDNQKKAAQAKSEFQRALHLYPTKNTGWTPQVALCSALENTGIDNVYELILSYLDLTKENGYFEQKRRDQNKFWLLQTIEEHLKRNFYQHPDIKKELPLQLQLIEEGKTTPFVAATFLLKLKDN
ncbi:methylmalonyl Co-A mutase-associated GTPase MeaB [Gangjinia marincola]|uniref:Methylmalonyl Co-A mutase-associated GTPase MeaB n=1 Tax=Gangjinia marincola TaxID=578463 RepID=A0ABP3XSE4_9FLAO